MALPEVSSPHGWLGPEHLDAVVAHLRAYARDHEGIDLARLASAPYQVLEQHDGLTIEHSDEPIGGCAVFGHYDPSPPTIHIVRASTFGRDHFTLLHEYAHHLQQHDPDWAEVEWRIQPRALRVRITEAVANTFASTALIPEDLLAPIGAIPTARQMAELHQSVQASRQAAIMRVTRAATFTAQTAGASEDFFVSLADSSGTVIFSQMVGDEVFPPPKDSHQPDIQRLFETALTSDGRATRVTSEGITYGSGNNRSDIRLDLHIAHDGGYAFVVGTKEHRYGKARWTKQTHLCPSAACETEFELDETITRCPTCGSPRCPDCRACDCETTASTVCDKCFTELAAADRRAGRTSHDECPW